MKKKLSYRDKLLELAYIYSVKEIQDYAKNRKNLTTGQIELILKKNKIIIPKEFKTSFFKENFTKPISRFKSNIIGFKEEKIKDKNRFFRKVENYKYDTSRKFNHGLSNIWKSIGIIGVNFLNILPKLGSTVIKFFGDVLTDAFNAIYNQQIDQQSAKKVIVGFFVVVGVSTITVVGVNTYKNHDFFNKKVEIKKSEPKKPQVKIKKETKKSEANINKKKEEKKILKKIPELKVKKNNVAEVILPDLNLKTETVIQLFEDVDYDLKKVRNEKLVKPIYFTQFPRDLDNLKSVQLKKETFIKIVLPLIVAENEKIVDDREKLKNLSEKKFTTDLEKQWLRQKLLEYKVKKSDLAELMTRMDIIPVFYCFSSSS